MRKESLLRIKRGGVPEQDARRTRRGLEHEAGEGGEGGGVVLAQLLQQRAVLRAQPHAQVPALQAVLQAAQRRQAARQHPAQGAGTCFRVLGSLWLTALV